MTAKEKPSTPRRPKKPTPSTKLRASRSRKEPAVDAWFAHLDHPLKPLMLSVRAIILASDNRVTESVKWSTPTFTYNGDIASLMPKATGFVSLMFHRGAEIPGKHPRLQGDARLVRTMRFASAEELKKYTADLQRAIRAWCEYKSN